MIGLARTAEKLGVFVRPGVPTSLGLSLPKALPPKEHNAQLLNSMYGKERLMDSQFPSGTVLWYEDPVLGEKPGSRVNDVASMRDSCFFKEDAVEEAWYVNGRARFYVKIIKSQRGLEVASERAC